MSSGNDLDQLQSTTTTDSNSDATLLLIGMSILSVGIGYATSIEVARILGPRGFEEYVVAIASLGLLGAISEAGVGKFALKAVPEYVASRQWPLASAYWRFGVVTCLAVSISLAAGVSFGEFYEEGRLGSYTIGIAMLFLPAIALSSVIIDLIMAVRASVVGMLIARLVIPIATLTFVILVGFTTATATPKLMVICFGGGSIVGLLAAIVAFYRRSPREFFSTPPQYMRDDWLKECASFALIGFLSAAILRVSIVVVELLPIGGNDVAYSAAAIETGCLILLLAKSTDKLFQPQMATILHQKDWTMGEKVRRERYGMIGAGCVLFLIIVMAFGKGILGLYGENFRRAYVALVFVSFGASIWTLFSLSPAYLRFAGYGAFVTSTLAVGAILMAALTAVLGANFGVTGVGIAFCCSISSIAIVFQIAANRHFRKSQNLHRRAAAVDE